MKFWHPDPARIESLCRRVQESHPGLCIDVGARPDAKFPLATETVGWEADRNIDLDRDPLPYGDGEVAFVYCRHTLEDLADPAWLLSEIARVARAGYIETPSAMAELTRGVDASGYHVGYVHHRWVCWIDFMTLTLAPKYPIVERLPLPDCWERLRFAYSVNRWNMEFQWNAEIPLRYRVLRHEKDFNLGLVDERGIPSQYLEILERAVQ